MMSDGDDNSCPSGDSPSGQGLARVLDWSMRSLSADTVSVHVGEVEKGLNGLGHVN